MVDQGRIENTIFPEILSQFGIVRNRFPFSLDSVVLPVALVATGVDFVASPSPSYQVTDIFTAGLTIAPGANTVLADTGALPSGSYTLNLIFGASEAQEWEFQWRDAANAANLWTMRIPLVLGDSQKTMELRLRIDNANERFRILNVGGGGVGSRYQASILAKI